MLMWYFRLNEIHQWTEWLFKNLINNDIFSLGRMVFSLATESKKRGFRIFF